MSGDTQKNNLSFRENEGAEGSSLSANQRSMSVFNIERALFLS